MATAIKSIYVTALSAALLALASGHASAGHVTISPVKISVPLLHSSGTGVHLISASLHGGGCGGHHVCHVSPGTTIDPNGVRPYRDRNGQWIQPK